MMVPKDLKIICKQKCLGLKEQNRVLVAFGERLTEAVSAVQC